MRKIEQQTIEAIKARKNWRCANMAVFYISPAESGNPHGGRSEVFLHGNHIADYWQDDQTVSVNTRTLRQWPSDTTMSRLRALGANVRRCKGQVLLNDQPL